MATSKTIASLIGPTLVAIAAGMLLNIGSFPELAEQVFPRPRAHLRVRHPLVRRRTCHCARSQSLDEGMAGACDHPWRACHPQWPCTNAFPNRPGRNCRRNWSDYRRDHCRSHRASGARRCYSACNFKFGSRLTGKAYQQQVLRAGAHLSARPEAPQTDERRTG